MNDFIHRGQSLDPSKIIGLVHKMLEDPSCHYRDIPVKEYSKLSLDPLGFSSKEDIIIFSDAAFKAKEGYASFGFVMTLNDVIVDGGAIQRPKVVSSKEAEARAVLVALEKAWKNGFNRLRILTDAQEVVYALKGALIGPLTQLF